MRYPHQKACPTIRSSQVLTSCQDLGQKANISSTKFSRTTSQEHCDAVQYLWVGIHGSSQAEY